MGSCFSNFVGFWSLFLELFVDFGSALESGLEEGFGLTFGSKASDQLSSYWCMQCLNVLVSMVWLFFPFLCEQGFTLNMYYGLRSCLVWNTCVNGLIYDGFYSI